MGILGDKDEEIFKPNCRVTSSSAESGIAELECQPQLIRVGKPPMEGDRITKVLLQEGKKAMIEDDGGIPDSVMDRLLQNIENKRLR